MKPKIDLTISTPNGIFFHKKVDIVTLKTSEGYIGIMRGIVPFVASIDISKLYINSQNSQDYKICAIDQGLVFAKKDSVKILTDSIIFADQIDVAMAQKDKLRAERALNDEKDAQKLLLEEVRLKQAINKIDARNELK